MAAQSYDRLEGVIWYDGKLVPWKDANLHVLSHGLHYASAVFEGERAYGGKIFKTREHAERLKRSAHVLDFEVPYSVDDIVAAKQLVVDKNGKKEALIDAWGPGNSRSSSGGETRVMRGTYGPEQPYTEMAARALKLWANA